MYIWTTAQEDKNITVIDGQMTGRYNECNFRINLLWKRKELMKDNQMQKNY